MPKPIRQLSEVSSTIQKGVAGAESIFEQLDEVPEVDTGTLERERVSGRLEVRDLSFVYPQTDKQVLKGISFTAEPGQMVALVGRSGSGKSTLANLIPRFYHHEAGQILLDGEDETLPRRHVERAVGKRNALAVEVAIVAGWALPGGIAPTGRASHTVVSGFDERRLNRGRCSSMSRSSRTRASSGVLHRTAVTL